MEGGFGARVVLLALGFGVEDEADDEATKVSQFPEVMFAVFFFFWVGEGGAWLGTHP